MHANLRQTLAGNGCQILFVCNGGIPADRTNSVKERNLNLGLPRAPVRLITQNHNPDLAERIEKVGRSAAENQLALKKNNLGGLDGNLLQVLYRRLFLVPGRVFAVVLLFGIIRFGHDSKGCARISFEKTINLSQQLLELLGDRVGRRVGIELSVNR